MTNRKPEDDHWQSRLAAIEGRPRSEPEPVYNPEGDVQYASAYCEYMVDCPFCGEVREFASTNPSGQEVDCAGCDAKFTVE